MNEQVNLIIDANVARLDAKLPPIRARVGSSFVADIRNVPADCSEVVVRVSVEGGSAFHDFPVEDRSRICLLDSATLVSIVHWLGAIKFLPVLRRTADGATVRALKAAIPDAYPAVMSFAAYFRVAAEDASAPSGTPDNLALRIVPAGRTCLAALLSDVPPPVLQRLRLKLPKELDAAEENAADEVPAFNPANFKTLLKLKFPEACELCC